MSCLEINPKITIITACLNAAGTIEQTIRSVLDQGYPNLEYIIVDGGSSDGTLDVVEKYRERISTVVSEPDNGIYDAFNKGIKLATGDLIGILNADDLYAPWTLKTVSKVYAEQPNYDVYFGKVVYVNVKNGKRILYALGHPGNLTYRMDQMSPQHPSIFVPKKTYDKCGRYDTRYRIVGDWDYFLGLFLNGARFYSINTVFTAFSASGISSHMSRRHLIENKWVYCKYFNKLEAFGKNAKMYMRYYVKQLMILMKIYDKYVALRDSRAAAYSNVEFSGEYCSADAASVWSDLREDRLRQY
ncbi:MAG: glycosyltransferase [Synergistaceae bacterium]|jgi:glycosyltransferase involved in cell wall biosynthesis|nr:glycosyltransferase [Synergistaceae bacterium]